MSNPPSTEMDLAGHIACRLTTQPQNSISDFFGTSVSAHGDALCHYIERFALAGGDHLIGHWRPNQNGTRGVNPNAFGGVFERRAFGQTQDSVFCGVIDAALSAPNQQCAAQALVMLQFVTSSFV